MNCEEFQAVVSELANGELMEAEMRQQSLAHAALCVNCASQLSAAKSIRAALHLTASAETESAPARVKQSLLAAFNEQKKGAVTPARVIEISSRRPLRWLSVAAIAAAAVLLLALILPSLLRSPRPLPESAKTNGVTPVSPATTPEQKQDKPGKLLETVADNSTAQNTTGNATGNTKRIPRTRNRAAKNTSEASTKKNTNEYLPLTYMASATAMESGTVVRIQLSRSALMSLGLPLNIERADGLIKADLVLGDDGVARAIRLVE